MQEPEYDPMNQIHPGPLEGIDRIPADTTQARTGNTEREQETWFAGIEEGQRRAEHNAAVRGRAPVDVLEIARETGLRGLLHGLNAMEARSVLQRFVDALPVAAAAPGSPASAAPGDAGESIKLVHLAVAEEGGLRFMTGRKLPDGVESCELYAMPDYGRAPAELFLAPAAGAQKVVIDFDQVGSAGPFPVVNGKVAVSAITVRDLVRMAAPAAGDAMDARRYRAIRNPPYSDCYGDLYAMTFQGDGDIPLKGDELDAAADAAIEAQRKGDA